MAHFDQNNVKLTEYLAISYKLDEHIFRKNK